MFCNLQVPSSVCLRNELHLARMVDDEHALIPMLILFVITVADVSRLDEIFHRCRVEAATSVYTVRFTYGF